MRLKNIKKQLNKLDPFIIIIIVFVLFLGLIILSSYIFSPVQVEVSETKIAKNVDIYKIGTTSRLKLQAQIEKSGVITITALTGGVVQRIPVLPGTKVKKGATLISLASNYQGGNIPALQLQSASLQLKNVEETYNTQIEIINKQKDIASKSENYGKDLRDIASKSIEETKSLIALNDSILSAIDEDIEAEADEDAKLLLKQSKAGYLSANNQLKSSLRNIEYEVSSDKPPSELERLQKDLTLNQLAVQEKGLELNKEITRLQYHIAVVNVGAMRPVAPFNSTVERVFVKVGEAVSPGTPLVVLSQVIEEDPITAVAYVSRELASKIGHAEPSVIQIGDSKLEVRPSYITVDAVAGPLYAVYFPIPDSYHRSLTNLSYVEVSVPVGVAKTGGAYPYVPIDSLYQSGDKGFVFVEKNGVAVSKEIVLGDVSGSYVTVLEGLKTGDNIILNRNILAGDTVTF